jgi:hypothetical protein
MQLKSKYDEAQGLGESVRQVKNRIGQMKSLMEQRRVERAMQGLSGGGDSAADPEEERMVATMERDRAVCVMPPLAHACCLIGLICCSEQVQAGL